MTGKKTIKKRIYDIIQRMAKLYQQRRMVKKLDNFFKYSNNRDFTISIKYMKEGVPREKFLELYLRTIFRIKNKSKDYQLDEINKINSLYKSCINDEFINEFDRKIRVSHKGSDLLHLLGFLNIMLEKYNKITLFLSGAFSILIIKLILSLFDTNL